MDVKKIALWLLVIGIITLIIGLVIGAFTFDAAELTRQITEYREAMNISYNATWKCGG